MGPPSVWPAAPVCASAPSRPCASRASFGRPESAPDLRLSRGPVLSPPCRRQRRRFFIAGDRHGLPLRVRARRAILTGYDAAHAAARLAPQHDSTHRPAAGAFDAGEQLHRQGRASCSIALRRRQPCQPRHAGGMSRQMGTVIKRGERVFVALRKRGLRVPRGNPLFHAVTPYCRMALCCAEPGARSEWAEPPAAEVTCLQCLRRLQRL
jgi:hypothetical protein